MTILAPTESPAATPLASDRGVTNISDRVVEKIAGRAAGTVEHVRAPPSTGLARLTGGTGAPAVNAQVDGPHVRFDIRLAVSYPAPVRIVARQVQAAVRDRVEALTGLDVTAVRVDIAAALIHQPRPPRVV